MRHHHATHDGMRLRTGRCAVAACLPISLAALLLLTACGNHDYPRDWPARAHGLLSRKGGCPDLAGEYDGIDQTFVALFFGGEALAQREDYVEHRATVVQSDDGASLVIDIAVNERGLDALEAGGKGGNVWRGYRHIRRSRGADYTCTGGWLEFDDVRFARDRAGGLIAHRAVETEGSIGWGSGSHLSTGTSVRNVWLHWPARDATRDAALAARGHFLLRRAPWINGGHSTPVYLRAFFARPICARYVHRYGSWPGASRTFAIGSVSDVQDPGADECPAGWARVDSGETQLQEMKVPDDDGEQYRYEWFRAGETPPRIRTIEIDDAGALPDGDAAGKALRIGQDSVKVN